MSRFAVLALCLMTTGIDWQPLTPAGGRFTVLMPGQVNDQKMKIKSAAGTGELVLFDAVFPGQQTRCVVGYTEYPAAEITAGTEDKRLDNARDAAVKSIQGKLTAEKSIVVEAYPGRELTIAGPGKNSVVMRLYAVNNRLYQMAVMGAPDEVRSKHASKFLDSFKLAK